MKKAIIFDLDGTLINSLSDIADAMNRALISSNLSPHEEEKYKLFTGDGAKNLTLRALGENAERFDEVYPLYAEEYAKNSRVKTAPYAGIPRMLEALHQAGLQLCVLSNKGDSDVKTVLDYYFPSILFSYIAGVRPGGPVKPDPRCVLQVLAALQMPAEDFWYVGDTATDMRCAALAGLDSIAVGWGYQTIEMIQEGQPKYFVETVEELQKLLLS